MRRISKLEKLQSLKQRSVDRERRSLFLFTATCAKYLVDDVDLTSFLRGHSGATSVQIYDRDHAIKLRINAEPRMRELEKNLLVF
uniref:Tyr recombinase domain-containing protein n=1 Tax=Parastrongyloides trichosuri TaxID=131310 RepID=A0A0N4ZJJ2_PARTI